jgi:hypothetical protein
MACTMLLSIPIVYAADQPYMGGHFNYLSFASDLVIMNICFDADYTEFPSNYWLGGVSSVAGASSGTTPSGWVYQNAVTLDDDNNVIWCPQSWYILDPDEPVYYWEVGVGDGNDISWYVKTQKKDSVGKIRYKVYWYATFNQLEHDSPYVYTKTHDTNDDNLIVGDRIRYYEGEYKQYLHFQFGVESNYKIDETNWEVLNDHIYYYDDSLEEWKYKPGSSCTFASSYITYYGPYSLKVGKCTYTGVNKEYSGPKSRVNWKYTGTTLPNFSTLWSGSGSKSDVVSKPYSTTD